MTKELKTIRVHRPTLLAVKDQALLSTEHKDFKAHGAWVTHDGRLELLVDTDKRDLNGDPIRKPFACFHKDHWVYYEIVEPEEKPEG